MTSIQRGGSAYLHIAKAAKLLGVSQSFVRANCAKGELLGQIVGGAWYIELNSIEFYKRRQILTLEGQKVRQSVAAKMDLETVRHKQKNAVRFVGKEIRRLTK